MTYDLEKQKLYRTIEEIYAHTEHLLFHGWHHILFVYTFTGIFAQDLRADQDVAQIAALVHDINYLESAGAFSPVANGTKRRQEILASVGVPQELIARVETIVQSAAIDARADQMTREAQALSDADTLFKALPTTPILFASRFITQTGYNIRKLSNKIIADQKPLLDHGYYFYSPLANKKYLEWAKLNLKLWEYVQESLQDPNIVNMLKMANINVD